MKIAQLRRSIKRFRRKLAKSTAGAALWVLLAPPLLFLVGAALNQIVMAANHGLMPVQVQGGCMPGTGDGAGHVCMDANTHLKFLADWIQLHIGTASIGDTLIWLGDWLWYPAIFLWVGMMLERERNRYAR